jgi:hypothetical protein
MNTRTLLNLVLVCVAVLLILVIAYRPGLEQAADLPPLTTVQADSIRTIRVTRKERTPLSFEKTASGWQLTGDRPLPASEFQLRALLGILDTRPDRRYPDNALDLAAAGLDPPQATLLLNDTVIYIGGTEALQHKRYIQLDDTVYLVSDKYQHLINADWTNFVERRLLPENAVLTGLVLPDVRLKAGEDGRWQATPPASGKDAAAIEALVAQWQAANATYIRRHEGTATGSAITLELAGNREPVRLYLSAQEPELVLARPDWGIQYHFPANLRKTLLGIQVPDTRLELDAREQGYAPPQNRAP